MTGPIEFEFQDDFESEGQTLHTSTVRRPDAVSLDYLTCFTYGPVAFGDSSEGNLSYIWRVRYLSGSIYVARSLGESWAPETLLFTVPDSVLFPPLEVDAAFDQNANIVVVCERDTGVDRTKQIWIYFYDTLLSRFDFRVLTAGRSPRALLDDPYDTANSDVLVFYVAGLTDGNQRIRYRQQRDRYLTGYATPVISGGDPDYDYFVEDVARLVSSRIAIIYSRRHIPTGKYELLRWESVLYPLFPPAESVSVGLTYSLIELYDALLKMFPTPEGVEIGISYPVIELAIALLEVGPTHIVPTNAWAATDVLESVSPSISIVSMGLVTALFDQSAGYDAVTVSVGYAAITMVTGVIEDSMDTESVSVGITYPSITLVTP